MGALERQKGLSKQAWQVQTGMGYSAPWLQPTCCYGMDNASGRALGHPEGVRREQMEGIETGERKRWHSKGQKSKCPFGPLLQEMHACSLSEWAKTVKLGTNRLVLVSKAARTHSTKEIVSAPRPSTQVTSPKLSSRRRLPHAFFPFVSYPPLSILPFLN